MLDNFWTIAFREHKRTKKKLRLLFETLCIHEIKGISYNESWYEIHETAPSSHYLLENEEESPIISSRIGSAVWENDQELRPLNAQQNEKLPDALR